MRTFNYSLLFFLFFAGCSGNQEELPYLGPKQPDPENPGETLHHQVPGYTLTAQNGEEFSTHTLENKVVLVDFFFTTCPTICPELTSNLKQIQEQLDGEGLSDQVMILSHTVDPKHDSAAVLKAYAEKHEVDTDNWKFLTGSKKKIYEIGMDEYMVPAQEDASAPGGFLHSGQFILLDQQKHIRGFYDGTDSTSVEQVIKDVKTLLN